MFCERTVAVSLGMALILLVCPAQSRADGGFFINTAATTTQTEAADEGLINSDGQRAVIWKTGDDCWDLFVEPGEVQLTDAAWVIPMPVVPDVGEASADFIDQLNVATTPIFNTHRDYLEFSASGGWGCGCGDDSSAGPGASVGGQTGSEVRPVQVWGSGSLSGLSYEVVSTETASALQRWLADNGYVVPETLTASIAPYVEDDYYFFVAKVEREVDDGSRVAVVRFTLCGADQLWYPMRLTPYSVADELDFTVFVVGTDFRYAPSNASWYAPGPFYDEYTSVWGPAEYEARRDEIEKPFADLYNEQLEALLELDAGRTMVVQYVGAIALNELSERLDALEEAGSEVPISIERGDWSSEFAEIVDEGLLVSRWRGSFPAAAMESDDLTFALDGSVAFDSAIYHRYIEYYDIEPPDSAADGAPDAGQDAFGARDWPARHRRLAAVGAVGPRPIGGSPAWPLVLVGVASFIWVRGRFCRRTG